VPANNLTFSEVIGKRSKPTKSQCLLHVSAMSTPSQRIFQVQHPGKIQIPTFKTASSNPAEGPWSWWVFEA
jgi:hypothetical protein